MCYATYNVLFYPGSRHNAIFSLCDSEGEFCSDINNRIDGYNIHNAQYKSHIDDMYVAGQVVQEYERAVVFRLGRLRSGGAKGPGLFFVMPCVDSYKKVDLRTVSFDVPPQEVNSFNLLVISYMNDEEQYSKSNISMYGQNLKHCPIQILDTHNHLEKKLDDAIFTSAYHSYLHSLLDNEKILFSPGKIIIITINVNDCCKAFFA